MQIKNWHTYILELCHYCDKGNSFDNSKFPDTTVHYTKHAGTVVCIQSNFGIIKTKQVDALPSKIKSCALLQVKPVNLLPFDVL